MAKYDWAPWRSHGGIADGCERLEKGVACRHEPCGINEVEPAADVVETRGEFLVEVELPGVKREGIVLEIHGRELTVRGVPRVEKDADGSVYHILERSRGPLSRVFVLPSGVEQDDIAASFSEGVLRITVPKKKGSRRSICIETSD